MTSLIPTWCTSRRTAIAAGSSFMITLPEHSVSVITMDVDR